MSNVYSKALTVGVMASMGAMAVTLWMREMDLALAASISLALFAYAFNWVPADE